MLPKSLLEAEGPLHSLAHLPPNANRGVNNEEEEVPFGGLAQMDSAYLGLNRCLHVPAHSFPAAVWGCVHLAKPQLTRGTFSYAAGWGQAAHHCSVLYGLLQHQHHLHLARCYNQHLRAASDFVCRLMAATHGLLLSRQSAVEGPLLRGLCEELRVHSSHWDQLQGHLHRDPWLRSLWLQQPRVVQHMQKSLSLLARQALCLMESCLETLLQHLACGPPSSLALLWEVFQGLEIYNQVVSKQAARKAFGALQSEPGCGVSRQQRVGGTGAFSLERVLAILATERGHLAGERLSLLLFGQQSETGGDLELMTGEGQPGPGPGPPNRGILSGLCLPAALQSLCQKEEETVVVLLQELLASSSSLWHHVTHRPRQEKPLGPPNAAKSLDSASPPRGRPVHWSDASLLEAALTLYAKYRRLFWRAASTSLACQLACPPPLAQFQEGAGAVLGQQLTHALEQACVPLEAAEELKDAAFHLLRLDVLWHWDSVFCRMLGTSLVDKCVPTLTKPSGIASSQTAQFLQRLYLCLSSSMRCLDDPLLHGSADHLVPGSLRLQLLILLVATSHVSCYWAKNKIHQYLASWSLSQFLLVAQGDLQLLEGEARKMLALVSRAFLEERRKQSVLASREQELSLQVCSAATSIQHFANDVLELFSLEFKRMAAEVFRQTMPLGKYWQPPLQTELPSAPSEYAQAAAQAVLGPVLQGIRPLPHDTQALVLSQAITAFLEVWMDHILAQKIRFSLQGALQLKQDFDQVQALLQSKDYDLPPELQRLVESLRVFQQTDSAVACLLQQPSTIAWPTPSWEAFWKCCFHSGTRMQECSPGSLENLEELPDHGQAALGSWANDLLSRVPGANCSSQTYLSRAQQEWLALRLQGNRWWRMPILSCLNPPSES